MINNQTQTSALLPISQTLQFNDTTEIVIVATDICNETWQDTMTFFIPDAPLDIVNMPDTSVCFMVLRITLQKFKEEAEDIKFIGPS